MKKTITCKTCGAEISPRAQKCPHCGEITPGEVVAEVIKSIILAPLFLIGILIALGWCGWLF